MAKKYNNNSNKFTDWTTKKLKEEAMAYHQMIYGFECYGCKDIMNYDGICNELNNRKVEIKTRLCFE